MNSATVTSCADDGGPGTLRTLIGAAHSGDTIDLSALTCSAITLQSGEIRIDVDDLTISGPGAARLAIDGNGAAHMFKPDGLGNYRVFDHTGSGQLSLSDLTITGGTYRSADAEGGCIYSSGSVSLYSARITQCHVYGASFAAGGGIYAGTLRAVGTQIDHNSASFVADDRAPAGNFRYVEGGGFYCSHSVFLLDSIVTGNSAAADGGSTENVYAFGGGGFSSGDPTDQIKYSVLSSNSATAMANGNQAIGSGGGFAERCGELLSFASTFHGNTADSGGGIFTQNCANPVSPISLILNSTISGNEAAGGHGGGLAADAGIHIANSTVAFNTSATQGAVAADGVSLALDSSILSNNAVTDAGSAATADLYVTAATQVTGSHNVVLKHNASALTDTIMVDPLLQPLAMNGGRTPTHAISVLSVALNNGDTSNDPLNPHYDQRGWGYSRSWGAPDIGAYEVSDTIFAASMDF